MTLIKFKEEVMCSICGRTARESKESMPFCCGKMMMERRTNYIPTDNESDYRADLVKPMVQVSAKPTWIDQREVWSIRRKGDSVNREQIGWVGKTRSGMYEFIMVSGLNPSEGVAYSMPETIQTMIDIASR